MKPEAIFFRNYQKFNPGRFFTLYHRYTTSTMRLRAIYDIPDSMLVLKVGRCMTERQVPQHTSQQLLSTPTVDRYRCMPRDATDRQPCAPDPRARRLQLSSWVGRRSGRTGESLSRDMRVCLRSRVIDDGTFRSSLLNFTTLTGNRSGSMCRYEYLAMLS